MKPLPPGALAAALLIVASVAGFAVDAPQTTALKTEHFDRDPGWEGHNNHIVPTTIPTVTQDFGWSDTHFAGKEPGEIGGRIQRASESAFYGAKIEPKTLDDKFSASGTFAITQCDGKAGAFFGWFSSHQLNGTAKATNSLGMYLDCRTTGSRLSVSVITGQNQVAAKFVTRYEHYTSKEDHAINRPTPIKNDGTHYHWKFDYDPSANEGNGRIQFTIASDSSTPDKDFEGKTFTVDLPAGFKKQGTTLDRFGIMNTTRPGSGATIHFADLEFDGRKADLARDPGWDGLRNHTTYQATEVESAQDFGFRTSNHAGGAAGELGGIIWRAPYAYYADKVGPFSLNDRLEAHGRLFFEVGGIDAGVQIGWFNGAVQEVDDKAATKAGNIVGVDVGGNTRTGHWFMPVCYTATGARSLDAKGKLLLLHAGNAYEWSFLYDPAGNGGKGQLRVTLGDESVTLDLKKGVKEQGASLDRFGVKSVGTGGGQVKLYLDDLQYSAAKP